MAEDRKETLHAYFSSPSKRKKAATDSITSLQTMESEVESSFSSSAITTRVKKGEEAGAKNSKKEERYSFLNDIRDERGVRRGESGYDSTTLFIPPDIYKAFTDFERQFWDIKRSHYDTVIFFKKGKFYELYEEDAEISAKLFDFKVVDRVNMKMSGFPEKSYDYWSGRFLENGYKIARVDQVENMVAKNIREREGSGKKEKIIKRELKEIVTSGTVYNNDHLRSPISVYLGVIERGECFEKDCRCSVHLSIILYEASLNRIFFDSFCDTDDFAALKTVFAQNEIKEVISDRQVKIGSYFQLIRPQGGGSYISFRDKFRNYREYRCFVHLASYMELLKRGDFMESVEITPMKEGLSRNFSLDGNTLRNIEVFSNNHDFGARNTLFQKINFCVTPFGQRLLKSWLLNPLKDEKAIIKRQEITKSLENTNFNGLREGLQELGDMERIMGKCSSPNPSAKDVISLVKNLNLAMKLEDKFRGLAYPSAEGAIRKGLSSEDCSKNIDSFGSLAPGKCMLRELVESFPDIQGMLSAFDAKFYCDGDEVMPQEDANDELCILIKKQREVHRRIEEYVDLQGKMLGYGIALKDLGKEIFQMEVKNDVKVPEHYFIVSTTKSTKRFYTKELKLMINEYVECEEMAFQSRGCLLRRVISFLMQFKKDIYRLSGVLAQFDVFFSFVIFSRNNTAIFPEFGNRVVIEGLRSPVFPHFVESDLKLVDADVLLLTGPNMGGKSTLLRSVCYNTILCQIGMKVLAKKFKAKVFDNIFTRIGASDNLEKGESTFMVELSETARILEKSTKDTFVLIDELGRGTSVRDGEAIARAVLEYLKKKRCTVFFSTHYHRMVDAVSGVYKGYMDYETADEDVVFLYRLVEGVSYSSHGISVAKMASLPHQIVERAKEIREKILATKTAS